MKFRNQTRRDFLKKFTLSTTVVAGFSTLSTGKASGAVQRRRKYSAIGQNSVILFQGDSITDAGRNRDVRKPNSRGGLGPGYAFLASAELLGRFPEMNLKCYNKGISGNKVFQLAERWEEDCLNLEPDILSILIGVNDFWHTLSHDYDGTVEVYQNDFRALLKRTRKELPNVKFIIGEAFALEEGSAIDEKWFPAFPEYQRAAREIAREFDAVLIPYQSIFEKASRNVPATYWSADGVHPSTAGSELMAEAWLDALSKLK